MRWAMIEDTSLIQEKMIDGYCGCGCGETTNIWRGKHRKFIKGHQARGSCNSRFGITMDDDLKQKISSIKKTNNKPSHWIGKKHKDSSKEKMSHIRKIMFLGEGNPFYGKHHSKESKEKIKYANAKFRANHPEMILPTKPEQAIHNELIKLGILFETEKLINDKFCVDVFVPKYNLIIYVDGCYWHACPIHCPNAKKPNYDNARVPYLTKCGYKVELIWEHDIKNDSEGIIKNICLKYDIPISTTI